MSLYIDGYNLIFAASARMDGFDIRKGGETEGPRERLLDLLAKFKSMHKERVLVFFDGGPEAAHMPRRQMIRGLDVLFSDPQSDADSDIKSAVSHSDDPRSIRVVTSDNAIVVFVRRYGAQVTDSRAFLDEVEEALSEGELPKDEPMEKYEGTPGDEVDYWMKVFGDDPGEGKKP